MLPVYGRQIVQALHECLLFIVRAALLLMRRSQGSPGRERQEKARSGRTLSRPLMGLLLVSLLLALQAAPSGGGAGLALSGFGACAEAALAPFANCSRFDPAPTRESAIVHASPAEIDAAMTAGSLATLQVGDEAAAGDRTTEASVLRVADVDDREFAASPARSVEHGSLARDRDLSAAAVARAIVPGQGIAGVALVTPFARAASAGSDIRSDNRSDNRHCNTTGACGIVQVSLR